MKAFIKFLGNYTAKAYLILVLSLALLYTVLFIGEHIPDEDGHLRARCASYLKQHHLSLRMYLDDNDGIFPLLSSEPGRLMWDSEVLYPEYSPDPTTYLCLGDEDRSNLETDPDVVREDYLDDWSYFYLSFAMFDDDDVVQFAEYYKARVSASLPFDEEISIPDTKVLAYYNDDPHIAYSHLWRIRDGVERFFIWGYINTVSHERARQEVIPRVPVLIERPGNHEEPGGHVLYWDGHVEFIEYPGKWPMTEKTIGILNELDALGEEN